MYIFYVLASLWIVKKKKNKELKWSNYPAKKQKTKLWQWVKKQTPKGCKKETVSKQQNQLFPLKSKLPIHSCYMFLVINIFFKKSNSCEMLKLLSFVWCRANLKGSRLAGRALSWGPGGFLQSESWKEYWTLNFAPSKVFNVLSMFDFKTCFYICQSIKM